MRSSLDVQLKWSEAQRVGPNQQGALLTACQEGPSRAASFKFITIPTTPHTLQRTLSRVYAFYGTETARACGRCVTGLDGRWLRRMLQRRRLNAGKRCENTQRWFDLKYFIPFGALVMGIGGPYRRFSRAGARRCTISFVGAQRPNSRLISNFTLTA